MEKNKTISEIIFGKKPGFKIYLFNKNKILLYDEYYHGFWRKRLYNNQNKEIYIENSNGDIEDNRPKPNKTIAEIIFGEKPKDYKHFFDKNEMIIYCETLSGYWWKRLINNQNQQIYYENSRGEIEDNRPKPNKTIAEIIFGENPKENYYNIFLYNKNNRDIYYERVNEFWRKSIYNNKNQQIYYEDSNGFIQDNRPVPNKTISEIIFGEKPKENCHIDLFDDKKRQIYYEHSDRGWFKKLYNNQYNFCCYFENSLGMIEDYRTK